MEYRCQVTSLVTNTPRKLGKKQDNATREMAFDANFKITRYVKQTYTQLKMAAVPIFFP